jgi:hypothetical protein
VRGCDALEIRGVDRFGVIEERVHAVERDIDAAEGL